MTRFENIKPSMLNNIIEFDAKITKISKPEPIITTATFECASCMRIHEVEQKIFRTKIYKPAVCQECGGRTFKLQIDECSYTETQTIIVGSNNTKKLLPVVLHDDNVSYDNYHIQDNVTLEGTLRMRVNKSKHELVLDCINITVHTKPEINQTIDEVHNIRNEEGYTQWRNSVVERDNVCQICGGTKHLEAHHLYNYKHYPDLRTDMGNGVTVCRWCHQKFHSYYGKNVTPVDLIKFIRKFGG